MSNTMEMKTVASSSTASTLASRQSDPPSIKVQHQKNPQQQQKQQQRQQQQQHQHQHQQKANVQGPPPDTSIGADIVQGYPKLAWLMGEIPDATILRRFATLNAQNLLYLQSELTELEHELQLYEQVDSRSEDSRRSNYARDFYWLNASGQKMAGGGGRGGGNDNSKGQFEIVMKIRKVLREYNTALLQQKELAHLPKPDKYDLEFVQTWLADRLVGNNLALIGKDSKHWGDHYDREQYAPDLIALREVSPEDRFSMRIVRRILNRHSRYADVKGVSRKRRLVAQLTVGATTVSASLLPVLGISVLYCVVDVRMRIGIIAIFSVLFSSMLTICSNAKRSEVFAATAAFAAVMAVFVGTNDGSSSGGGGGGGNNIKAS